MVVITPGKVTLVNCHPAKKHYVRKHLLTVTPKKGTFNYIFFNHPIPISGNLYPPTLRPAIKKYKYIFSTGPQNKLLLKKSGCYYLLDN